MLREEAFAKPLLGRPVKTRHLDHRSNRAELAGPEEEANALQRATFNPIKGPVTAAVRCVMKNVLEGGLDVNAKDPMTDAQFEAAGARLWGSRQTTTTSAVEEVGTDVCKKCGQPEMPDHGIDLMQCHCDVDEVKSCGRW